jgi:hypothetical protein
MLDSGLTGTAEEPRAAAATASSALGKEWNDVVPDGHSVVTAMPLSAGVFKFGSAEGDALVGSMICWNNGDDGWAVAEITGQNTNRRHKQNGSIANFQVMHADGAEKCEYIDPSSYGTGHENTWVLLEAEAAVPIPEVLQMTTIIPKDFKLPAGYSVCDAPPDFEAMLTPMSEEGLDLVDCLVMYRWEKWGWCQGRIHSQAEKSRALSGVGEVNFLVEYDDGVSEHVLSASEYCTEAKGPMNSWCLLVDTPGSMPESDESEGNDNGLYAAGISDPELPVTVAQATEKIHAGVPHPFVHGVDLQMDNCGGTNKNQYVFGCLALLCAFAQLDVCCMFFMVANHGKFAPDFLFQKTATKYNCSDTFNEAMLLEHVKPYCSPVMYDGERMLRTWKEASVQVLHNHD